VVAFFALTYTVSWTCFVGAAALPAVRLRGSLLLLGTFAPAAVALGLAAREGGKARVAALLRRVLQWQVAARWYALAVGYLVAIKLGVAFIDRAVTGAWPRFGHENWVVIVVAIVISTPFQSGEEIGWRGYALPRLASRFGLARASLILGVIWACWHLPLFFVPLGDNYGQSFTVFLLEVTALSVALAWVWMRTSGSLLLTMLMHSAVNQTKDIVPSSVPGATHPFALSTSLAAWLTVALMWLAAVYFLVRMPRGESSGDAAEAPAV
jgi:CAAX protease family protein